MSYFLPTVLPQTNPSTQGPLGNVDPGYCSAWTHWSCYQKGKGYNKNLEKFDLKEFLSWACILLLLSFSIFYVSFYLQIYFEYGVA
jgi:hypothetical protein